MKNESIGMKSMLPSSSLGYEEVRVQIKSMLPEPVEFDADQNLVELGLDSLQMMRLVSHWQRAGSTVTFAELIASPRLSDWWPLLQTNHAADSVEKISEPNEREKEPFPLTDVQYAYWIGRRDDQPLGGVGCHAYLEIDGKHVDPERLESAWGQLLTHHSMLRARFLENGEQEVLDTPLSTALAVHDFRHCSGEELTRALMHVRDRLSHRRLEVEKGEVAGIELSLLPEGYTRLHVDIDLLVADVQSLHIILRDLAAAYARDCRPAAPIDWRFADYVKQKALRRASDKERAARYWQEQLPALPAAPELPLQERPEAINRPVFKRRNYFLEKMDWDLLQQRAAVHQVTPAMVLLTAYAEVLDRWSTNSHFFINIPLFDRQTGEPGIEEVVADFTNLLLLAVDCSSQKSFLERVRSVQAQFHQDVAHAAYSGVQLIRDLARVRQHERHVAPVVFACNLGTPLINDECRQTLGDLTYMISQTPQVWLDFQIYEMDGGLLLAWDAVEQLFPEGLIDQMFAAYVKLLKWLTADGDDWKSSLDTLWAAERPRWDREVDLALTDPAQSGQCLHTSFFEHAAERPQETALIDSRSHTSCSYGELSVYALRVAAFLKEKGVREGDPVAVTLPRGIDQIAAVLGILAVGACYVPISMEQPSARRDRIHHRAGIRFVLACHELVTMDWPTGAVVLNISDVENIVPLTEPVDLSPEHLAYIIFTSGSTGEPKGVEISHAGAWNTVADINRRYQVGRSDRVLAVSSLDFDLSVYDMFGLLGVGGSLVLISEETYRDAASWLKLVNNYEVTIWNTVPVLLDMLLVATESERKSMPSLRLTMLSGDWISLDLPSRLKKAAEHSHLVAMGGATEASIWSNYFDVSFPLPAQWTSIPYGRPLFNQAYRIVDDKGRDCPDWVTGELWIGGAGIAKGYRGEPELSAERFVKWNGSRWYRTGDLGRYWPDGNIEFLGRKDFQVKIRGHRIELGEIETALKKHPGVHDAVVTVTGDPRRNKQLVGYVVPDQENVSTLFAIESVAPDKAAALWTALEDAGRKEIREGLLQEIDPETFPAFWEYKERLSVCYICRALQQAGAFLRQGEKYTLETLLHHCGIQPRYRELVRQWLDILTVEGVLKKDETGAYISTKILPTDFRETLQQGKGNSRWEEHAHGLLRYLQQIGQSTAALLKGDVNPLDVFFADDHFLSPDHLLQSLPGAELRSSIAGKMVKTAVQRLSSRAEPLRILEIGSRCTNLTRSFISLLPPDKAVYTCTDQSAYFINDAKGKYAAERKGEPESLVDYRLLDIDQHPQDQGYRAHSYDIIIAADSLHRARNIDTALSHIQSLLAPGGLLLLMEMTRNSRLQQVSTGFLEEGFTRFEDERRADQQPLLAAEKWLHLLQSANFAEVTAFPEQDDPAAIFGQHVIAACAPQRIKRFEPGLLSDFLSEKLPGYMIPSCFIPIEKMPLTSNGKVNRQALPNRAPVRAVKPEKDYTAPRTPTERSLADIWCQILNMKQIDITADFFELGGDSLLATRLSAVVREQLKVELSIGSIFERPTIAELAECVQALIREKEHSRESVVQLPEIIPADDERHLPFPLTDIQQAYWVGRSGVYSLGNVSTHCYFEIEGMDLDLERINRAWQRLIDQHDMMRAVILPDGQQQKILKQVPPYRIAVTDLRRLDADNSKAALQHVREEMSHQVLSTDEWPLFDVRASLFEEKHVRLHISFDNLLFDGWSMFYLLSEWSRLYRDADACLSSLDLSFRDYVLALERLEDSDLYERDREYWFNRLSELPPAPELPLAQNPELLARQRFSRLDAKLDRKTWQHLKKRTAGEGLTPSSILLTAYAEVLAVWSIRPRFTINLTQFNRLPLHPQVQNIVGDFTSLTLLAVDQTTGMTFLERARNLQQQLWEDLDHPYVGGVQVQRELAKRTGDHQGVAMPVVFTSALGVDQWGADESDGKWLGKLVYNITQTPQVWLDHQVVEQDGELLLIWDAVDGLFPSGLLDDMFAAYCHVLRRLANGEAEWRKTTPNLVSVPRLEQRIEANDTDAPVSSDTLVTLFAKQAVRQPDHPAVICSGRSLTYADLSRRSDVVGNLLREKGARPNTLVAVVMEKGWEQVVAVLGILKSGAAYLPVDPSHPEERRLQLLRDGGVSIVLTQSRLEDERLEWPAGIERLYVDRISPGEGDREIHSQSTEGKPEDLAYVIYTSGSTGVPKGVMIDHRGAVNTVLDVNRRFSVGPEDRIPALANLNFDLSVYDIFGILAAGATIVIPEADHTRDPAYWLELMEQEQVTVWNTVPTLMHMLLEFASGPSAALSSSLRLVLLSGDWIPLDLPGNIKAYFNGAQVVGLGGATEASIWSNLYPIGEVDEQWKSIPYGRPMTNQRYCVLNEWLGDCPVWVPGQLYIGGVGLAKGYWNDESKTEERFIRHPRTGERLYCTGDMGRYLPDGNIEFLGREDFQVKIRGHRIELGEIETTLKRHDGVQDAIVGTVGELSTGKQLVGYVVLDESQRSDLFATECVDPAVCTESWQSVCSTGQRQASNVPDSVDMEEASVFMDVIDRVSVGVMCSTLDSLGIFTREGEQYSPDELLRRFQLSPRFRTLIFHWLDVLTEEGLLQKSEEGMYMNHRPLNMGQNMKQTTEQTMEQTMEQPELPVDVELILSPDLSEKARTFKECFRRGQASLIGLLKGEIDPLELFLTEDSFLTPEALSEFNLGREYYLNLSREIFRTVVDAYPSDKEIRVLEIGTRAGSLTDTLAPLLPAERGRYIYADESTFFTDQARKKWGKTVALEYNLFDMNKKPLQQGYEPHCFDVIVADNTLHRARNMERTLEHLQQLLAPGGLLIFTEATRHHRLMLTTVGFFEDGFSHFEDDRKTNCLPLLSAEKWREVLYEKGFSKVLILPENVRAADIFGQHLIVAQAPDEVRVFKSEALSAALRCKLPEYMVPAMYVLLEELPLSANGKVDRKALAAIGKGKERPAQKTHVAPATELQAKIAGVWEEVLGCTQVGMDDSFFELGGDSLRAIQCINLLKERCGVELSLQNLFDAPNIVLLAQLIETEASSTDGRTDYEEGTI